MGAKAGAPRPKARRQPNKHGEAAADGQFPAWDETLAARIIGKTLLVGITLTDPDGSVAEDSEFHGIIIAADRRRGIAIACQGANLGRRCTMPPVLEALEPAEPGTYRLRTTAETLVDPDYTMMWTVSRRPS